MRFRASDLRPHGWTPPQTLHLHPGARRLRQLLVPEARLQRRNQVGRRRAGLDFKALNLLPRDLLLDRLQQALPIQPNAFALPRAVPGREVC